MKILICIKEVIDHESPFIINDSAKWYDSAEKTVWKINYYDQYALEAALVLKDNYKNAELHVLSMGPERVKNTIRYALERGADRGFHVEASTECDKDPYARGSMIAAWAADKNYDLIFCGLMSEDTMAAQTGQVSAAMLDIPCATFVTSLAPDLQAREILIEREVNASTKQTQTLRLPALLTFQSGIHTLRYPTLTNKLKAMKMEIETIMPGNINTEHGPNISSISYASQKTAVQFIEGTSEEKVQSLTEILKKERIII